MGRSYVVTGGGAPQITREYVYTSVWSHRNYGSGEPGVWHGYATYGGNRPDVAASHGEQFRYSGYTKSVAGP